MKVAICDDEKQFIDSACLLLEQWAEQHNTRLTLYKMTNGDDLIATHRSECMDLILLDIIMPLLNGIDTAKEIRDQDPSVPIIFLTSSKEFAVDSYDVKAFHYLMKPVDRQKLYESLDSLFETHRLSKSTFIAQTIDGFCRIVIAEVDYLEAQNKKVLVHLSNGDTMEIRELFTKCISVFSPDNGFCHCHRSYIVNLSNVERFTKTAITTSHNATIPISRNKYMAFKDAYFHHMFTVSSPLDDTNTKPL